MSRKDSELHVRIEKRMKQICDEERPDRYMLDDDLDCDENDLPPGSKVLLARGREYMERATKRLASEFTLDQFLRAAVLEQLGCSDED